MKTIIFSITVFAIFITSMASVASATAEGTLCGAIYPESVLGVDRFVLSTYKDGQFTENHILATTAAAQNFIAVVSVHGGKICKPKLTANSPAMVCLVGDLNKLTAEKIGCQKSKPCAGFKCSH